MLRFFSDSRVQIIGTFLSVFVSAAIVILLITMPLAHSIKKSTMPKIVKAFIMLVLCFATSLLIAFAGFGSLDLWSWVDGRIYRKAYEERNNE